MSNSDQHGSTEPDEPSSEKRFTKADAKLTAFGIVALLAGIFLGQNTGQVKVRLVFASANIRLIWVFLLCIGIGIVLDRLLTRRGVIPAVKSKRPPR